LQDNAGNMDYLYNYNVNFKTYSEFLSTKKINIYCPYLSNKICLRSNTSDFLVYNQVIKYEEYLPLIRLVNEIGYVGTGKKFGVSDNAIRKWIRFYTKYEN
jgi:hypothetical protein